MGNLSSIIKSNVDSKPDTVAISLPGYNPLNSWESVEKVNFSQFWSRVSSFAKGLKDLGAQKGDRIIVLIPLSVNLYALSQAIMSIGCTVVLIDGGQTRKKFLHCLKTAKAFAIISTMDLFKFRFILPSLWWTKKIVLQGAGCFIKKLKILDDPSPVEPLDLPDNHGALITFTSGSTGMPKGANRTQFILTHQHLALKNAYPIIPGQVHMTCFPVVALHNLCCGISTVMPAVDFKNVGSVNPEWIVNQINAEKVNSLTGAPAYMKKITDYCLEKSLVFDKVLQVGVGGAPVETGLCQNIINVFPNAQSKIIYGSTEAEPIASFDMKELVDLSKERDISPFGYPGGYPDESAKILLINPKMETISVQQNQKLTDLCSTSSSFGELIVSGKHVNETYFENPQANLENKILDENNVIWHRTGDIAQMDSQGRIWLKGRLKSLIYLENGKAILPLEIESFFNKMNNVIRTALQKIGNDIVLWVQTKNSECRNELTEQFKNHISKRDIPIKKLIFLDEIPVDGRHQSKVDYVSLKSLADIREGIEIEI